MKTSAIAHEACYRLLNKDTDLVASHLSPIHPTTRFQREKRFSAHLQLALCDSRIINQLGELALTTLPMELRDDILSYAWPSALLITAVFQWACSEVLSAGKGIPLSRNLVWNIRKSFAIQYTSILGVRYVVDISSVEDDLGHGFVVPKTADRVVVASDEY
jgi:hypothetical protein